MNTPRTVNYAELRRLWQGTQFERWETVTDSCYVPLDLVGEGRRAPALIITAFNPDGHRLNDILNNALDASLFDYLIKNCGYGVRAGMSAPRRIRAKHAKWHEEGWLVGYEYQVAMDLIQRYQQLAAWVLRPSARMLKTSLLWADGTVEQVSSVNRYSREAERDFFGRRKRL